MAVQGVSGTAVAATAAGAVLLWSGIKGASVTSSLRSVLSGTKPTGTNVNQVGSPSATAGNGLVGTSGGSLITGVSPAAPALGQGYTTAQVESIWVMGGGSPSKAATAACIAAHESGGVPTVTSSNPDGGTNVGLWQLDTPGGKGAGYSVAQLQNALTNARVAVKASADGTDWSAWATASMCGVG